VNHGHSLALCSARCGTGPDHRAPSTGSITEPRSDASRPAAPHQRDLSISTVAIHADRDVHPSRAGTIEITADAGGTVWVGGAATGCIRGSISL
jgi:hypothetical protein